MDCLKTLISLDGCESSSTAIYDLAKHTGLSREQLHQLIDDSYANIDDWFDGMKDLAAKRLATDVITHMDNSVKVNTLLENSIIGDIADNKQETTHSDYVGVFFDTLDLHEYMTLSINKVSLFTNYTGDVDVLIQDVKTGENIATRRISCVAGEVKSTEVNVDIPINARERKIAVIYDASGITSYKTTIYNSGCSDCGSHGYFGSRYASVQAVEMESPFLRQNKSKSSDTGGMQIDFSFSCNQKNWVCSVSNLLGLAMLYKTAYEMLSYSLNSGTQFSDQQTNNLERNIERRDNFEFRYGEELKKVLQHIKIPKGLCFYCNTKTEVLRRLP
jgi:hypothetical protein